MAIDIVAHNRNSNYPRSVYLQRLLWGAFKPLFRWSPRWCYGWRNALLRLAGAEVGRDVRLYPTVDVMYPWQLRIADHVVVSWGVRLYSLARITLQSHVLISQGAHLCAGTHDHRQSHFPLVIKPVTIESGAWLAAECFIGPGVQVGRGAVVGARAVVTRDVPPDTVVVGNPARIVGPTHA
jgi:putative colanic acid biosynthesis acetyltransferase WcaF